MNFDSRRNTWRKDGYKDDFKKRSSKSRSREREAHHKVKKTEDQKMQITDDMKDREKLNARALKFGLVPTNKNTWEDEEKLKARALRFGMISNSTKKEEDEKMKARKAKFGL